MSSYANDFTLLAFAPCIMQAEAWMNLVCSTLVRWAEGRQLAVAPQKSSIRDLTSDTYLPVLAPRTSANQRQGGPAEHNLRTNLR